MLLLLAALVQHRQYQQASWYQLPPTSSRLLQCSRWVGCFLLDVVRTIKRENASTRAASITANWRVAMRWVCIGCKKQPSIQGKICANARHCISASIPASAFPLCPTRLANQHSRQHQYFASTLCVSIHPIQIYHAHGVVCRKLCWTVMFWQPPSAPYSTRSPPTYLTPHCSRSHSSIRHS